MTLEQCIAAIDDQRRVFDAFSLDSKVKARWAEMDRAGTRRELALWAGGIRELVAMRRRVNATRKELRAILATMEGDTGQCQKLLDACVQARDAVSRAIAADRAYVKVLEQNLRMTEPRSTRSSANGGS